MMKAERRENVLTGLIGAFLGSLIGVACIVAIGQLGYVASISGVIMAVCAIKGYELLGGAMSRKGAVIACILIVLMTYLGNLRRAVLDESRPPEHRPADAAGSGCDGRCAFLLYE